jgi:hypothetical protein
MTASALATATVHDKPGTLRKSCIKAACTAVRLTISNPPVNLWDTNVPIDLNQFLQRPDVDNETQVIVEQ